MTRTTADWEKLLKGITPAPWETLREDDTPVWTIGRLGDNPARIVGDIYGESNARLATAAPEAVAEAVRLRRELEEMLEYTIYRKIQSASSMEDKPEGSLERSIMARWAHHHGRTEERITRILGGEQ